MSYFTSAIAIALVSVGTVATAPQAFASPSNQDRLVANYLNPSVATKKVETTLAKIQGLLEVNCDNANPKAQAKCDAKKINGTVLLQIRKSTNIKVTIANLSGVKPAQVNPAQVAEAQRYSNFLKWINGANVKEESYFQEYASLYNFDDKD
jgi:Skp family chaperone for outer membrane proteins